MKKEFVTAKEIALKLGVISSSGKPHSRVIAEVFRRIGIKPVVVKKNGYYDRKYLPVIRNWFHQSDLPAEIWDQWNRKNDVFYVPCKGGKPVYEAAI